MPAPAGTGLSRRSFLLRTRRPRAERLRRQPAEPARVRRRDRRGRGQPGQGARLGLPRGRHRRALGPRAGRRRPATGSCARPCGSSPGRGRPGPRTRGCTGIPSAAPLHQLHGEGKVTVFPGDRLHERRPVPLHLPPLLGGRRARASHTNTGWLGRLLDAVGTDDNPLQGLSLDGSLSPSLATARVPVAATWGASYDLWAPGRLGRRRGPDVRELRRGSAPRPSSSSDPQLQGAGRVVRQASTLRGQLRAFSDEIVSPVPYPDERALLREPRRARGDARRRAADHGRLGRRAGQLRHPRRPDRRLRRTTSPRPATGCSPSSATSRPAGSTTAS